MSVTGVKLTEKETASEVKSAAKFVITQLEGDAGSEVESIRRAAIADVIAALTSGIAASVASTEDDLAYILGGQ